VTQLNVFTNARINAWRRALIFSLAAIVPLAAAEQHSWTADDLTKSSLGTSQGFQQGQRPDSIFSRNYVSLLTDDTRDILTAPLRWDRHDWLLAGGLLGLVAASATSDRGIKDESQETITPRRHAFTRRVQSLGSGASFVLLGAFETYGYFAEDNKAKAVAMDGLTASIIASGMITPLVKVAAGRARPNASDRIFDFKPFGGAYSFPSGHTTQAFAVASVISSHYDQWWVQGLSYGLAGLVGYSRIEQNSHYASDVVAGAIIGTVVGQAIVKRHNKAREGAFTITPYFGGQGNGILFNKEF
jgi:hypothetical protein